MLLPEQADIYIDKTARNFIPDCISNLTTPNNRRPEKQTSMRWPRIKTMSRPHAAGHTDGDKPPKEVNVIVWGPGTPWPPLPVNSSWLIADAMPRVIFRDGDKPNIRIVLFPEPVESSWSYIRKTLPRFWDGDRDLFRLHREDDEPKTFPVAAAVHMGMLDQPNEDYRLEKHGYKKGYELPDVDGKHPDEDDLTGGGTWKDVPDRLDTALDVDYLYERVKSDVKDANIVISHDHERFLCGYEYYTSLAELYNRKEKLRAVFLHTPIEHDSASIEHGVHMGVALVKAMVEDLEKQAAS
ncbi:hypothetical protein CPLU01_03558 [Colletotrichum plurivorum]|uniref:Uncharacterized protein n=1 Tax=Colletotrichum plurivorum TaxID=2175906 RepID=A0A8H6NKH5_9PEZI|nr:hypothetical protein CPLU01_03558 [Colletotrichum plurivorum]